MTEDSWIGQTIDGRYVVRRLIGKGGMGAVYEGEQPSLERKVALKFLLARDDAFAQRLRREAKHASQVVHEHVAQVYDVGRTPDGHDYLVMEYVEGTDLQTVLDNERLLTVQRAVHITRALLEGLGAIHALGIVHRDIKPSNVLLTRRGEDADFVKLGDFGLARTASDAKLTKTGNIVGTTPFMAPEMFRGEEIDHRTDLYAVGITLYYMLAGKLPFVGVTAEVGAMHVWQPPPPLAERRSDVPSWLVRVIERALAKRPDERFPDARAFIDALDRKRASRPSMRPSPRPSAELETRIERAPRKRGLPLALLALALVLVAGGIAVGAYLARSDHPVASPTRDASSIEDAALADVPDAADPAVLEVVTDAAAAIDARAAAEPDAGVAKHAHQPGATKACVCVADGHESTPLCPTQGEPKCRCRRTPGETPLCPLEPASCSGANRVTLPDHLCASSAEYYCPDVRWYTYKQPGKHGAACDGYTVMSPDRITAPVYTYEHQTGTFECDTCPNVDYRTFRGSEGDRCTGYSRETGEPVVGTLRHCE